MARIELRDCTIRMKDGLSGTAAVNETTGALASPAQSTSVQGVPATTDEVQAIEQYAVNFDGGTFTLTFDLNLVTGDFTTAAIAYNANAAAVQTAINVAATAAGVTGWANDDIVVTGTTLLAGDLTLTFSGNSVDELNHGQTTINGALLTSSTLNGVTNLDIDTVVLNSEDTDLVPIGARFTVAGESGSPVHVVTARAGNPTTNIVFSPALLAGGGVLNNAVITVLPQQIEITVGEGNLTYTEAKEYTYDLDRGDLDTVREGNEVPMEVSLEMVYDHVTTGTDETVTPVDALKGRFGAAEWVSASSDPCEPYAIDIEIEHVTPCGSVEDEVTVFPSFRYDNLEFDLSAATIACTGRCNVTEPDITRS